MIFLNIIKQKLEIISSREETGVLNVEIKSTALHPSLLLLRDEMNFDAMQFMSAIDWIHEGLLELIYFLYSYKNKSNLAVRTKLSRTNPKIISVADLYKTADWHERETHELFGIHFTAHPDLRNLLLPENFEGFPLRKDFTHPNMIPLPKS